MGDKAEWSLETYILSHAAHGIWVANWQRAQGKKHQYPKPIRPEGSDDENEDDKTIGSGARSFAEIDALLAPFGPEVTSG